MSYLHLSRTRTRARERSPSPPLRSIIRRDTKRSRFITLSDDEDDGHDDYPYSSSHRPVKPSRALTIRDQPSQLERYNIWSDRHKSEDREEDKILERSRAYRHTSRRDDDDDDSLRSDPEEREFRLKVAATFSRPQSHPHQHHHEAYVWPGDMFRRKGSGLMKDGRLVSGRAHVRDRARIGGIASGAMEAFGRIGKRRQRRRSGAVTAR
jgi:hypothetical protein